MPKTDITSVTLSKEVTDKVLMLFESISENSGYRNVFVDSILKNKNYKELKKYITNFTREEKDALLAYVSKQIENKENYPQVVYLVKGVLKRDLSRLKQSTTIFSRLSLPSFTLRARPVTILNIEASTDAAFANKEIKTIKFVQTSSKKMLSTNTKLTNYSISSGDRGLRKTAANKARYEELIKDIFEKLNNSSSKMATLTIPRRLDSGRVDMLIEAINIVRMDKQYQNVFVKLIDQTGKEIAKPAATVAPNPRHSS